MKYDSGFTPVPQDYSAQQRQDIVDGLKDRLSDEEARIQERREKFHKTLLPLCDITSENNRKARQVAYKQNYERDNLFAQYKKYKEGIEQLQYQRNKAGAGSFAKYDKKIEQMQGFMTQTFDQYTLQDIQAGLANQASTASRFEQIWAFNDAISEGFSLAGAELDLGKLKNQIGFFDSMA